MERLRAAEIRAQLKDIAKPFVVYCRTVGNQPIADCIRESGVVEPYLKPAEYGVMALRRLRADPEGRLVILCDLHCEGNEPAEGVAWNKAMRTKGAILGTLSHLMMLMRNPEFRDLLSQNPDRLVVATVDDGTITVQEEEGLKMVRFYERNMNKS